MIFISRSNINDEECEVNEPFLLWIVHLSTSFDPRAYLTVLSFSFSFVFFIYFVCVKLKNNGLLLLLATKIIINIHFG